MKKVLIFSLLLMSSLSVSASKSDEVIGCWGSATASSTLYLTRDRKFVYTTKDTTGAGHTSTGEWKYLKAAHTMHLNFDDRPVLIFFLKDIKGGGVRAVNSKKNIDLKYLGSGKCD